MKKDLSGGPYTMDNLQDKIVFGQVATDPLEDLRDKMDGGQVKKLL